MNLANYQVITEKDILNALCLVVRNNSAFERIVFHYLLGILWFYLISDHHIEVSKLTWEYSINVTFTLFSQVKFSMCVEICLSQIIIIDSEGSSKLHLTFLAYNQKKRKLYIFRIQLHSTLGFAVALVTISTFLR